MRWADKVFHKRLQRIHNYEDARCAAQRALPKSVFQYVDGGAEDELTMRRNTDAFRELEFSPRGGVWTQRPDTATSVLGISLNSPVMTAPCGGMRLLHPDGDLGIGAAARRMGIPHVATSSSGFTLEEIAEVSGPKLLQVYKFSDEKIMKDIVRRAARANYDGLVATIDTSVAGNREKDIRNGFSYDMRINLRSVAKMAPRVASRPAWCLRFVADGMPFEMPNTNNGAPGGRSLDISALSRGGKESHSPDWDDIRWIRSNWDGPLIVKGVLTTQDALFAKSIGADGVVVSNHGGRQLDGAPSSLSVLERVIQAVGDDVEVLLDSGIRRGSDVVKALSLGARAVLIGRYPAFGLAAGGQKGVEHVLSNLQDEVVRTLQLLGARSVQELDSSWVQRLDRFGRSYPVQDEERVTL